MTMTVKDLEAEIAAFIPPEKSGAVLRRGPEGRVLWAGSLSPYGHDLAVMLSALVKCIRVSNWRDACWFGHQLFISGEEAELWVWKHLRTVAIEDVGPAEPTALLVVAETERSYFDFPSGSERRYLAGFWVVRYLSSVHKDRSNDEAYAAMIIQLREGALLPEIPDRAYDFHMKRGKDMGRGMAHFFTEATLLVQPDGHVESSSNPDRDFLIERACRALRVRAPG